MEKQKNLFVEAIINLSPISISFYTPDDFKENVPAKITPTSTIVIPQLLTIIFLLQKILLLPSEHLVFQYST